MKRAFLLLWSTGCQPVLFGSLPKSSSNVHSDEFLHGVMGSSASCRRQQAGSLCSTENYMHHFGNRLTRWLFIAIFASGLISSAKAVTLQEVFHTTLDNNPAILEAKAGLEQAAGKRLVFRSIVWPDLDLGVPAGLQYGCSAFTQAWRY